MTRDEVTKLLEILVTNYGKNVANPKALADSWEMVLGSYSAEAVYKATRLHMETSKFFPNPADIREKMIRASILYDEQTSQARLTSVSGAEPITDEKVIAWVDAFCEWIGFGTEPNEDALDEYYKENPEMRKKMEGILPYEL